MIRRLTAWGALVVAGWSLACSAPDPAPEIRGLLAQGQLTEAYDRVREELDRDPGQPELQLLYARMLVGRREFYLAEWPLRKAAQDPEYESAALLVLAQAQMGSMNGPGAVEVLNRLVELEPDRIDLLELRAKAHLLSVDPESALADTETVLEREPDRASARADRLHALLLLERGEEAEAALEQILDEVMDNPDVDEKVQAQICAVHSRFTLEKGDPEGAAVLVEECLEKFPTQVLVVNEAVRMYRGKGQYGRIGEVLEEALERDADQDEIRMSYVEYLRAKGDRETAELVLRESIERHDPHRVQDWLNLYEYFWQEEEYSQAIEALRAGIALRDEPLPVDLLMLADAYVEVGNLDAAEEVAQGLADGYRNMVLGRLSLERGDPARARVELEAGIRIWPNNATARLLMAQAAAQLGDMEDALTQYTEAYRIEYGPQNPPEKTDSAFQVARIQAAAGAYEGALDFLTRHLIDFPRNPDALELYAVVAQRSGHGEKSAWGLEQLSNLPQQSGRAMVLQAQVFEWVEGDEKALEQLERFKIDWTRESYRQAFDMRLRLLSALGRNEEALAAVQRARTVRPNAPHLMVSEARVLSAAGQFEEARQLIAGALDSQGDQKAAEVLLAAAEIEAAAGETAAALTLFDQAVAADEGDSEAAYRAARAYSDAGRYPEAETRFRALLRKHPFEFRGATGLAEALLRQEKDLGESSKWAIQGVAYRGLLSPYDIARPFEILAEVQFAQGATEDAEASRAAAARISKALSEQRQGRRTEPAPGVAPATDREEG